MGTQQLMILVVVIIVAGAAIVVGYTMFQQQNYIINRSALSQDMQIFLTQVQKSYMLLVTFGGPAEIWKVLTRFKWRITSAGTGQTP